MKFKNYYKILELETNKVTIDQIKSAYRKQAKKYHPDVNVGDKLAEEKIKDVNEAYRILSNPSTKRKYDRTWNYNVGRRLNHTKTSGQMAGEIFGMFFGSGDTAESIDKPNEPAIRGEDIETEINISLEEGFYGANKTIVFKDLENKDKTITIKLPEGVQENEKIRLMGQGKTGKNGGKNGDMFIKINIEDSKKFKLDGINLYDSISTDPHKVLMTPYAMSALLVKDSKKLETITSTSDLILKEPYEFGQITPFIGSKSWMSLKVWFAFQYGICSSGRIRY